MSAVALFPRQVSEFPVFLKGAAAQLSLGSIRGTNGIFGFVMFVVVAAVAAPGEQLRERRMILFLGNNAAAGALIRASSERLSSFWRCIAHLSAAFWTERGASDGTQRMPPAGTNFLGYQMWKGSWPPGRWRCSCAGSQVIKLTRKIA